MIKFRCLRCSQKIAVNDAGIGVDIACPTCAERLIVPPTHDYEFLDEDLVPVGETRPVADAPRPLLIAHLARLLKDRLVQALLSQRRALLVSQEEVADQIGALEQRVALVQSKLQRRLSFYEDRFTVLQAEVNAKTAENFDLKEIITSFQAEVEAKDADIRDLQERLRKVHAKPIGLGAPPKLARNNLANGTLVGA